VTFSYDPTTLPPLPFFCNQNLSVSKAILFLPSVLPILFRESLTFDSGGQRVYLKGHSMWVLGPSTHPFCHLSDLILMEPILPRLSPPTLFYSCSLPFWSEIEAPTERQASGSPRETLKYPINLHNVPFPLPYLRSSFSVPVLPFSSSPQYRRSSCPFVNEWLFLPFLQWRTTSMLTFFSFLFLPP